LKAEGFRDKIGGINIEMEKKMAKKSTAQYYQRLKCYSYYRGGNRIQVSGGIEVIMTGFLPSGIKCICDDTFEKGDVAILNIHIDGYPYEKLMCNIIGLSQFGEMKELDMEIMGMPNKLHDKIHAYETAVQKKEKALELTKQEKTALKSILKKLDK